MGQRPHLSTELENLVAQAFPEKKSSATTEDMELLKVLVKLFYSCTNGSPSQRPTVKEIFTTLSEVSRPTSIKVDSPFQEEASDAASNKQVTGPNVVKPLVEGTAAIEAGGEKECLHPESKSISDANPA